MTEHPVNPTPDPVNEELTANRASEPAPVRGPGRRSRARRGPVENTDYAAFATRVIRAHARRVTEGDIDALPDLTNLSTEVEEAIRTAITGLRTHGYSWTDIATRLGTTRQAAQQRWGR
jgi:hypothetical protein